MVKRPRITRKHVTDTRAKRLPRISLFFFKHPKLTFLIWLALVGFGVASYAALMQREGFPAVQAPLSIVNGTYLVNDPQKVDQQVAKPISEIALKQEGVKSVSTYANASTFNALVQYKNGTEPKAASKKLEEAVQKQGNLPKEAEVDFLTIEVSKFTTTNGESYDLLIAFYGDNKSTQDLANKAQDYVAKLNAKNLSLVQSASLVDPFAEATNPATGQKESIQTGFDTYVERAGSKALYHNDVVIGIKAKQGADTIKLYEQVKNDGVNNLNGNSEFKGYRAAITASFGPQIQQEISELQSTLLEGLAAVLIVGTILIALRASLLTIFSMVSVIFITIGILNLFGYTLNVITLFALILGLALIVDDTIIMTEALDVERRRQKNAEDVVKAATKRVSLAMIAATSTAALGFAPIIFVGGILGGFIRPIPITIITSLVVSLVVALTLIPFAARFLILRKNNIGPNSKNPLPVRLQESFAHKLTAPLRWTHHSGKRLWTLGITAIVVGFAFIFAGTYIFKYVTFNIFPSDKDSDQMSIQATFPAGTDINKAQEITNKANRIAAQTLGSNFKQINNYATGNSHDAQFFIDLVHYTDREATAPQLVDKLKASFKDFNEANIVVSQQGAGGPPGEFNVLIQTPDRPAAQALAADMAQFLSGKELTRTDGSKAHITQALVAYPDSRQRKDNKELVQVSAKFDGDDTSTLVELAKKLVQQEYDNQKLAQYNLKESNIVFDFGFEEENQESFKSMLLAFPILLIVMYVLLAIEFRSTLQPLLIFMAIPFSFFGVAGGLYLTDNPFSFFTMLGFFALIGLSIKNTILLTDYANQGRRLGLGRVDAISFAVEERFRPLLATSATAVIALLPLALTSPFWEALAFTLIFGLISSTTLVLLVFPYYYLGAEYLRMHISRKAFFKWLVLNIVVIAAVSMIAKNAGAGFAGFAVLNLALIARKIYQKRKS